MKKPFAIVSISGRGSGPPNAKPVHPSAISSVPTSQ